MGYARIYFGSGIAASLFTLFLILNSLGFNITSDGDKACDGTIEDPCISYINVSNPTSKSVYIYNKDNMSLEFIPDVDHYELYVKYYGKWVYTNFTMETRLSNIPKDRLYVFVFPAYSTKEFKLVGYKKDPNDIIKWTFSGDEIGILDPVWNVSGNYTYNYPDIEPDTAFYNDTLYCSVYANFTIANTSNYEWSSYIYFFKNGIYQSDYDNLLGPYNTTTQVIYSSVNVSETLLKNDSWVCKVKYITNNITNVTFSQLYNSSPLIISSTLPSVSLVSPANNTVVDVSNNYPVTLRWNITEHDTNDLIINKVYGGSAKTGTLCLQEDTIRSNQTGTDGDCELQYTGNFSFNGTWLGPQYITDGSYSSGSYTSNPSTGYFFFNYTKPRYASNTSIWRVGMTNIQPINLSVGNDCFSADSVTLQLRVESTTGGTQSVNSTCWNGSIWRQLNYSQAGLFAVFLSEESMIWNITNYPLLYNVTSNATDYSFNWNILNSTPKYFWQVSVTDGNGTNVYTALNEFNISFLNWSINYSVNVSSFVILPNASNGTFYPKNQTETYGVFNVTNNHNATINLSVNLSGGLPEFIDLYFASDNLTGTYTKVNISTRIEKNNNYSRYNDSTLNKNLAYNDTQVNVSLATQPFYKYNTMNNVTFLLISNVNTTYINESSIKFYVNNTLLLDFTPLTYGSNSTLSNLSIDNNASYTICGLTHHNYINITNSTLNVCTNLSYAILYADNNFTLDASSRIIGDSFGSSGGNAETGNDRTTGYCDDTGGNGGSGYTYSGANGGDGDRPTASQACGGGGGGGAGGMVSNSPAAKGGTGGNGQLSASDGGSGGSVGAETGNSTVLNEIPIPGGGAGGGGAGGCGENSNPCDEAGSDGAAGNRGGAGIKIIGRNVLIRGNISSNGGNGGAGGNGATGVHYDGGGGGGGNGASGGEIIIVSTSTLNISSKIDTIGGSGGAGGTATGTGDSEDGNCGDVGTGGRIKFYFVSIVSFAVNYNTSKGATAGGCTNSVTVNSGTYFNSSSTGSISYTNTIDATSTANTFLATCTEVTKSCQLPIRLEGKRIVEQLNYTAGQTAVTGVGVDTFITNISSNSTKYLWAKAIYNNSPIGAIFNFTWTATT